MMYLHKDGNDPSLQQLSFQQMFQQLTFQHDLGHLALSMDFLQYSFYQIYGIVRRNSMISTFHVPPIARGQGLCHTGTM